MLDAATLKEQALAYRDRRLYPEAAEAAHRYLQLNPTDMPMLLMLADCCLMTGYVDEAERIIDNVHQRQRNAFTYTSMARVYSARGDLKSAERAARDALKLSPDYQVAWQELSAVHKFREGDPLIAKARRLLKRRDVDPKFERALCYVMCKAMNDIRKWDKAWDYATRGSAIERPEFNPASMDEQLAHQREAYDKEFLSAREGRGHQSTAPIFVVGMPRSGTTLVEAILAATGVVTPMGELTVIPQIGIEAQRAFHKATGQRHYHLWTRTWPDASFAEAADFYLADVKRRNNGVSPERFVDKLPGNALHMGEIALMFPKAHIIRVERDPLDTCCSCYLGRFGTGHHYATRPDWLGHAARVFYKSAEEMAPAVPNPVLNVRYEELVSDPEPQIRRMLEFAGLDWNPNCLTPGGEGHTSLTRSKAQIRQSISPRSVGRWKRYKNRIAPLAEALGIPEEEWRARCEEQPARAA